MDQPVEGYGVTIAEPYENRHLLDKVPDYYERLQRSYDGQFFEQEVLGKYLSVGEGQVYYAFDRQRNLAGGELAAKSRCAGRSTSTWTRCVRSWRS